MQLPENFLPTWVGFFQTLLQQWSHSQHCKAQKFLRGSPYWGALSVRSKWVMGENYKWRKFFSAGAVVFDVVQPFAWDSRLLVNWLFVQRPLRMVNDTVLQTFQSTHMLPQDWLEEQGPDWSFAEDSQFTRPHQVEVQAFQIWPVCWLRRMHGKV